MAAARSARSQHDSRRELKLYRKGNAIRLQPATPAVMRIVAPVLTYTRVRHLMTYAEKREAGSNIELTAVECFEHCMIKDTPQVICGAGYESRLVSALTKAGYRITRKDFTPENPNLKPYWGNLADVKWRYQQKETLQKVIKTSYGRIHWATGSGKSWLIPMICALYPKAKVVVTTKHLSTLETIYNRLVAKLPSVGIYTSKRRLQGRRVMCFSAGSLNHAVNLKPDIVIADEVHELATDIMFRALVRFPQAKMISLSANDGDRSDNADFELEGIFGPVISALTYEQARQAGMVVPIQVYWRDVFMRSDPSGGMEGVPAARAGIWRNRYRNRLIAQDARVFEHDQVLITCRTLEHACYLKKELPEFELCYAPSESHDERIEYYKQIGLLDRDVRPMTHKRFAWMRQRFEQNKLKKVIATTVWNRGVSFDHLQVLLRADASASSIDDTQIPGRLSRTLKGKKCGILIDYRDQFSEQWGRKANTRRRHYTAKKWKQIFANPDDPERVPLQVLIDRHADR